MTNFPFVCLVFYLFFESYDDVGNDYLSNLRESAFNNVGPQTHHSPVSRRPLNEFGRRGFEQKSPSDRELVREEFSR